MELTINDSSLKESLSKEHPFIKAEVVYVIKNEMVTNCNDIVERRLGLSLRDKAAAEVGESWVNNVILEERINSKTLANVA